MFSGNVQPNELFILVFFGHEGDMGEESKSGQFFSENPQEHITLLW
jgi:hypothetical protein